MLNPLHLTTLRSVLHNGSFALAAKELGYTASAVSQQIAALERAAGVALFERTPRSIRPTAAAMVLADRSRDILAALGDLERDVRMLGDGLRGRVRVGSFATASRHIIPSVLAAFLAVHPEADLLLDEGEPAQLFPALMTGELDVVLAYRYAPVAPPWPDDLAVAHLLTEAILLLVREGHPAARAADAGAPVDFGALRREKWISSPGGTQHDRTLIGLCADASFTPTVVFRSNEYEVLPGLVEAGVGIALVAQLGYQDQPNVRALPLPQPAARRHIVALHRRGNANPLLSAVLGQLGDVARLVEERLRRR